jgi:hypothetical protein
MAVHTSEHINGFGELAVNLAKAVGLDADNCLAFTIEVHPDRLIEVRANQQATANGIEEVTRLFETAKQEGATPVEMKRPFIPVARLEDLRLRAVAGSLTNAERLALAVLAGGSEGESGVPALIDAAQEEYGHGSYRVPVRVVGNKKQLRIVITPRRDHPLTQSQRQEITQGFRKWINGESQIALVPAGWSVQAFEAQSDGSEVDVSLVDLSSDTTEEG